MVEEVLELRESFRAALVQPLHLLLRQARGIAQGGPVRGTLDGLGGVAVRGIRETAFQGQIIGTDQLRGGCGACQGYASVTSHDEYSE